MTTNFHTHPRGGKGGAIFEKYATIRRDLWVTGCWRHNTGDILVDRGVEDGDVVVAKKSYLL